MVIRVSCGMRYKTYSQLLQAYASGELTAHENKLIIDGNECYVMDGDIRVFEGNPFEDFIDLLNLLGIPNNGV